MPQQGAAMTAVSNPAQPTTTAIGGLGGALPSGWDALLALAPVQPLGVLAPVPPLPANRPALAVRDRRAAMVRPYVHWPRRTARAPRLLIAARGFDLGALR
jgi:hypothetical protein